MKHLSYQVRESVLNLLEQAIEETNLSAYATLSSEEKGDLVGGNVYYNIATVSENSSEDQIESYISQLKLKLSVHSSSGRTVMLNQDDSVEIFIHVGHNQLNIRMFSWLSIDEEKTKADIDKMVLALTKLSSSLSNVY